MLHLDDQVDHVRELRAMRAYSLGCASQIIYTPLIENVCMNLIGRGCLRLGRPGRASATCSLLVRAASLIDAIRRRELKRFRLKECGGREYCRHWIGSRRSEYFFVSLRHAFSCGNA
jgi:hypothetical protein